MMKIAIIDCRADNKTVYALENIGFSVIPTIKLDFLYDAVLSHADIQIHCLGADRFVCAPETFEYYKKHFPHAFELIKGSSPLGSQYPDDIAYNTAAIGGSVICAQKYTDNVILSQYRRAGKKIINVRQGYAKCSTCVAGENAVITSDSGIAAAAELNGIDVLKISEGNIRLRGMNYGFIGGASGLASEHTLAVNGNINTHPDADRIKTFCKHHKTEILCLKDGILEDIGTIITNINI